jgi:putative transposase
MNNHNPDFVRRSCAADGRAAVLPGPAPRLPVRHSPAHTPNVERWNQGVILFVTVCSKDRRPVLAQEPMHDALRDAWSSARSYLVGRYVIMPDHLHLFCAPAVAEAENVMHWVAFWKRRVSCSWTGPAPLWERHCWDTQLRDARLYDAKWEYVVQNPVRNWLVRDVSEWPYQGCMNVLRW